MTNLLAVAMNRNMYDQYIVLTYRSERDLEKNLRISKRGMEKNVGYNMETGET